MSSDQIQRLPSNPSNALTPQETKIMNSMFGASYTPSCNSPVKLLISGLVFMLFSLPFVDSFIANNINTTSSIVLAVKTGLFMLVLVIVQLFE